MPTSSRLALYNGALSRPQPRRRALFLRQPARERRHADALGLAHLPVLHDECQPAGRLGRRLFRLDRARRHRLPPLWRHLDRSVEVAGTKVALREVSNYPWSGDIKIAVDPADAGDVRREAAHSRLVQGRDGLVNGEAGDAAKPINGYVTIHRTWAKGDVITLDLPMPAGAALRPSRRHHGCRPRGAEARAAGLLRRGSRQSGRPGAAPEAAATPSSRVDARRPVRRRRDAQRQAAIKTATGGRSIAPAAGRRSRRRSPRLPYYLWANRGQGSMVVWIPEA